MVKGRFKSASGVRDLSVKKKAGISSKKGRKLDRNGYQPTLKDYAKAVALLSMKMYKNPQKFRDEFKNLQDSIEKFGWDEGKKKNEEKAIDRLINILKEMNIKDVDKDFVTKNYKRWTKEVKENPKEIQKELEKLMMTFDPIELFETVSNVVDILKEFFMEKTHLDFINEYNRRYPEEKLDVPKAVLDDMDKAKDEMNRDIYMDIVERELFEILLRYAFDHKKEKEEIRKRMENMALMGLKDIGFEKPMFPDDVMANLFCAIGESLGKASIENGSIFNWKKVTSQDSFNAGVTKFIASLNVEGVISLMEKYAEKYADLDVSEKWKNEIRGNFETLKQEIIMNGLPILFAVMKEYFSANVPKGFPEGSKRDILLEKEHIIDKYVSD